MSATVTELRVIICGNEAGTLHQSSSGTLGFQYDSGYQGIPLSLAMPVSNRVYPQRVVLPYLFGLLPDSKEQRRAIARICGTSPNNPMALLRHIGLDCPGGVQFCLPDETDRALSRPGTYRKLSEHDIALRLETLRTDREASWVGREESWSLGGNQGKFALALRNGSWCECLGSSPTTHIFKNGVAGFALEALNEYICMLLAERCEIPTAHVEYRLFEDEPALIVERYDRLKRPNGTVVRLHQEDLCQALGVMPDQKYTSDGGPAAHDILSLLAKTDHAALNAELFTRMLFFNCLIGAPDAHAKNYSLILGHGGSAVIARMYDVASGLAYEAMRRKGRLAMSIGGENRFGRVGGDAVHRYAEQGRCVGCSLDDEACLDTMADLARRIPEALSNVFDESSPIPGIAELRAHLENPVQENCEQTLRMLG